MLLLLAHLAVSLTSCPKEYDPNVFGRYSRYTFCKNDHSSITTNKCNPSRTVYFKDSYTYSGSSAFNYEECFQHFLRYKNDNGLTGLDVGILLHYKSTDYLEFDLPNMTRDDTIFISVDQDNKLIPTLVLDVHTSPSLYINNMNFEVSGTNGSLNTLTLINSVPLFSSFNSRPTIYINSLSLSTSTYDLELSIDFFEAFSEVNLFNNGPIIFKIEDEASMPIASYTINHFYEDSDIFMIDGTCVHAQIINNGLELSSYKSNAKTYFGFFPCKSLQFLLGGSGTELQLSYSSYNDTEFINSKIHGNFITINYYHGASITIMQSSWPTNFLESSFISISPFSGYYVLILKSYSTNAPISVKGCVRFYIATNNCYVDSFIKNNYNYNDELVIVNQLGSDVILNIYELDLDSVRVENQGIFINVNDFNVKNVYGGQYRVARTYVYGKIYQKFFGATLEISDGAIIKISSYDYPITVETEGDIRFTGSNYFIYFDYSMGFDVGNVYGTNRFSVDVVQSDDSSYPLDKFHPLTSSLIRNYPLNFEQNSLEELVENKYNTFKNSGTWDSDPDSNSGTWTVNEYTEFSHKLLSVNQIIPLVKDLEYTYNSVPSNMNWKKYNEYPYVAMNLILTNDIYLYSPLNFDKANTIERLVISSSSSYTRNVIIDTTPRSRDKIKNLIFNNANVDFRTFGSKYVFNQNIFNLTNSKFHERLDFSLFDFSNVQTMKLSFDDYKRSSQSFENIRRLDINVPDNYKMIELIGDGIMLKDQNEETGVFVKHDSSKQRDFTFTSSSSVEIKSIKRTSPIRLLGSSNKIILNNEAIVNEKNEIPVTIDMPASTLNLEIQDGVQSIPFDVKVYALQISSNMDKFAFTRTLDIGALRVQSPTKCSKLYVTNLVLSSYIGCGSIIITKSLETSVDIGKEYNILDQSLEITITRKVEINTPIKSIKSLTIRGGGSTLTFFEETYPTSDKVPIPESIIADFGKDLEFNFENSYKYELNLYLATYSDPNGIFENKESMIPSTVYDLVCAKDFDCEAYKSRLKIIGSYSHNGTTISLQNPECRLKRYYSLVNSMQYKCLTISEDMTFEPPYERAEAATKLSKGAIAGISIGVILFVALIALVIAILIVKGVINIFKRNKSENKEQSSSTIE